jgi:PAS domain S-box-containing protein
MALDTAANAIAITDGDGVMVWVNPAFTRLTGFAPDEAVGRTLAILKSGQQDPRMYDARAAAPTRKSRRSRRSSATAGRSPTSSP